MNKTKVQPLQVNAATRNKNENCNGNSNSNNISSQPVQKVLVGESVNQPASLTCNTDVVVSCCCCCCICGVRLSFRFHYIHSFCCCWFGILPCFISRLNNFFPPTFSSVKQSQLGKKTKQNENVYLCVFMCVRSCEWKPKT